MTAGEWLVTWSAKEAAARHRATGRRLALYKNEVFRSEDDGAITGYAENYVVSVVGPVASYQYHYETEGGAHPSYGSWLRAIKLEHGVPQAQVSDLFEPDKVLHALGHAEPVKEVLAGRQPRSLAALVEMLGEPCWPDWKELLSSFAVMDVRSGQAVVRFGLGHGCEASRGSVMEFDLLLPIPKDRQDWFANAQRGHAVGMASTWGPSHEWRCCIP